MSRLREIKPSIHLVTKRQFEPVAVVSRHRSLYHAESIWSRRHRQRHWRCQRLSGAAPHEIAKSPAASPQMGRAVGVDGETMRRSQGMPRCARRRASFVLKRPRIMPRHQHGGCRYARMAGGDTALEIGVAPFWRQADDPAYASSKATSHRRPEIWPSRNARSTDRPSGASV